VPCFASPLGRVRSFTGGIHSGQCVSSPDSPLKNLDGLACAARPVEHRWVTAGKPHCLARHEHHLDPQLHVRMTGKVAADAPGKQVQTHLPGCLLDDGPCVTAGPRSGKRQLDSRNRARITAATLLLGAPLAALTQLTYKLKACQRTVLWRRRSTEVHPIGCQCREERS